MPDIPVPDLSDESSFYGLYSLHANIPQHQLTNPTGSEGETTRLEQEVTDFNTENYWRTVHAYSYNTIKYKVLSARQAMPSSPSPSPASEPEATQPIDSSTPGPSSNPPSTPIQAHDFDVPVTSTDTTPVRPNRPSPNEPISSFLARLPPSTTHSASATGQWIYVSSYSYQTPQADIKKLKADGAKELRAYEEKTAQIRAEHGKKPKRSQSQAGLSREITKLRMELERKLSALAKQTNVVSGKWMLFVSSEKVDEVWGVVAEATAKGELGFGAKVATAAATAAAVDDNENGVGSARKARLIAIYTKDFRDKADVERVLRKMVELKLVDVEKRPIYYKCDAYTHLDIMGNNAWGLRASMFSSRDFGKK
ncbi:hypothetical protein AbraIFM66951_008844 [Aspergillus brasiliensis]|uniref:DUF1917 domain-containing protein n=1 Tax=Aspergillus brasiliensis TaxID=319629 RepID=A0A9W5YQL8_9EURO|nr:hypothetical protein AbraCBS73388_008045 [Aspergillus brasiliensis]GKZ45968.1 hypothetical protein AbraIFM66951_008844 [Aspergillus brasiliensis]